jgi:hypothetical protein
MGVLFFMRFRWTPEVSNRFANGLRQGLATS